MKLNYYLSSLTRIKLKKNDRPKVMSYNIRCDVDKDEKDFTVRALFIKKNIQNCNPDIIGLQECRPRQLNYFLKIMKNYQVVYSFRDESTNSESLPLFFRKDRYECISSNSFHLSNTPDVISKSWDSACYRIATYALLKDKYTNKQFVVMNTHLDHKSSLARINGLKIIKEMLEKLGLANYPYIIFGDMNEEYKEVKNDTLKFIEDNFIDAAIKSKNNKEYNCTYQEYGTKLDMHRIDYILASKEKVSLSNYDIITTRYDYKKYKAIFPSDHYPIICTFGAVKK